jgi:hypothetical protein
MDGTTQRPSAPESGAKHLGPLEGKVIGALDPSAVEAATAGLVAAGFPADHIEVVTADDLETLEAPLDRPGLAGLASRFVLSLGDDLDEIEQLRQELADGSHVIGVPVEGDDATQRVRDILRGHGARGITHFGRWTITTFE